MQMRRLSAGSLRQGYLRRWSWMTRRGCLAHGSRVWPRWYDPDCSQCCDCDAVVSRRHLLMIPAACLGMKHAASGWDIKPVCREDVGLLTSVLSPYTCTRDHRQCFLASRWSRRCGTRGRWRRRPAAGARRRRAAAGSTCPPRRSRTRCVAAARRCCSSAPVGCMRNSCHLEVIRC